MKKTILILLILLSFKPIYSQAEKYPIFNSCDSLVISNKKCFNNNVKEGLLTSFKVPEILTKDNFKGTFNIVFSVSKEGVFNVIYVNTPYIEIKNEVIRVFKTFPIIKPAKFNNHAIEMQFVFPLSIPLNSVTESKIIAAKPNTPSILKTENPIKNVQKKTLYPEHPSQLNIPFTHNEYHTYDSYLDQGNNTHTAVKPYIYAEVDKFVDLDALKEQFYVHKNTWFGKKLLNEHMGYVKGKDYWFTIDPGIDLEVGNDNKGTKTYNNTRSIHINGAIGKNLSFSTSFFESQGRFADYVNNYAESIRPDGGNPAIIPGRGIAKDFNGNSYDYPVAEAYLSYSPTKHFNFQFGRGKNFIGDGYRSLFLSDAASPYPFFKVTTNFWKIKYTNFLMWMQDVRPELTVDGAYKQKFMAMHYLDWNVTNKLNLGFFETVIWDDTNNRGLDVNYLNPLIFYNSIEFSTGSRAGNTLLGLSLKYKFKSLTLYSQFLLDDFKVSQMTKNNGWWGNKNGIQLGLKYYNAFHIENLYLQAEYNRVRPYTYSHDELNYNFGHNNQPLAHLWGANFKEYIGIATYSRERLFANLKIVFGKKGFDFNNGSDLVSYGGDVFADNDNRLDDYNNQIGQGNTANVFISNFQTGYIINPATNLKLFVDFIYRKFDPIEPTKAFDKSNLTWISFGLKTNLFNWYFDF